MNDLRRAFTLANAYKEGDLPVGGTRDDAVREDARRQLLHARIADIRRTVFVADGVSDALERLRDRSRDAEIDQLTVARLKQTLLGGRGAAWARAHRRALSSEVVAAVAKVMSNSELASIARRLVNPLPDGIGAADHLGSRIQPNSPGDDEEEILFSVLEGLSHGCGDVILGLNPAADEVDTIVRLEQLLERIVSRLALPTRFCVLSDLVKQHQARTRTRVDVGFQSLAGTSRALAGMVGLDVAGILDLARDFDGLYFETGQGSAITNGTAEGVDMVTLESRAYGVARHIQQQTGSWMIVNDVAGFIGPEVFRTAAQLERACLEDLAMARLHGLTMGLDVCSTFHMGVSPAELRGVTQRVVAHGAPAYLMAVAGNADPMLGYLTTSFREHPVLRRQTNRGMTPQMQRRVSELAPAAAEPADRVAALSARYVKAGGDFRTRDALEADARRTISTLQERGFDIGLDAPAGDVRVERLYEHARRALMSTLNPSVVRDACPGHVTVRTSAVDRDDYLAHPSSGERIRPGDAETVTRLMRGTRVPIQLVVSDGLNADAINEQLRPLIGPLRRLLADAGRQVAATAVIVHNGRVRAGYHLAQMLDPDILIHVIGERPGTGINTASAYLTYGRDEMGRSRWDPQLDHAYTTAVCGIHRSGKPPEVAAAEIARTVGRMLQQRRSGVSLR